MQEPASTVSCRYLIADVEVKEHFILTLTYKKNQRYIDCTYLSTFVHKDEKFQQVKLISNRFSLITLMISA